MIAINPNYCPRPLFLVVPFCLVQGLIERWYLGKRMGADELLSVVPNVLFGCPHSFAKILNLPAGGAWGTPTNRGERGGHPQIAF